MQLLTLLEYLISTDYILFLALNVQESLPCNKVCSGTTLSNLNSFFGSLMQSMLSEKYTMHNDYGCCILHSWCQLLVHICYKTSLCKPVSYQFEIKQLIWQIGFYIKWGFLPFNATSVLAVWYTEPSVQKILGSPFLRDSRQNMKLMAWLYVVLRLGMHGVIGAALACVHGMMQLHFYQPFNCNCIIQH
jgi:hypothetical protein